MVRNNNSLSTFGILSALVILSFFIPPVELILKTIEVYAHEMGHAIAAIITGGQVNSIELNFTGSGSAVTSGGIRPFVVFAGYAFASLFGYALYKLAANNKSTLVLVLPIIVIGSIAITGVFLVRNLETLFISSLVGYIFYLAYDLSSMYARDVIQFIGLYVLYSSIISPVYLFFYDGQGDAYTLSQLLLLPEIFWIILWCIIGLYLVYRIIKKSY